MTELRALERVDFETPAVPAAALGAKGELKWINVTELGIDPDYQRPVLYTGRRNVRRMVEGFSWSLFSPLVVARRGRNLYAIIDGQHRALAAVTHGGVKELPCLVLSCPRAEEALALRLVEGSRGEHPSQRGPRRGDREV